ncbi:MAG: NUDIX domain-containing protein [Rhizobiaceae bacterium]|nr:NUDIX domain-containing protein [Hyphomicrobiales bacterium]NRB31946.1 NUDIX domain-containing protein [Rhizobiaceae bacterium]
MLRKAVSRTVNVLPSAFRKRLFVALGLSQRAMTLGVRILLRNERGEVLLVRHTYVPGWYLPGGGVERHETVQQAAIKELREECSVEALDEPQLFHFYRNPRTSRFDHVALFICDAWREIATKQPDHEIAEIGFFAPDNLPDGTTEPTRHRIAEVLNGQKPSDVW